MQADCRLRGQTSDFCGRVLLGDLVDLAHRHVDLCDAVALSSRRGSEFFDNAGHPLKEAVQRWIQRLADLPRRVHSHAIGVQQR